MGKRTAFGVLVFAALAVSASAARAGVSPATGVSTAWLQELYAKGLEAKQSAKPVGLCRGAQGLFTFDASIMAEPGAAKADWYSSVVDGLRAPMSDEKVFLNVLDGAKAAITDFMAHNPYEGTKLGMIAAGRTDVANRADVAKYVERAVKEPALTQAILAHTGEFGASAKRLYHVDAVYGRKVDGQPFKQSFLRWFVIVDMQKGELVMLGNGDCDF